VRLRADMDLLILDTSKYDDPLSDVWHASLRYTTSFLRGRGVDAAISFVPALRDGFEPAGARPLALYFEFSDDNVAPSLGFIRAWRRSLPDTKFFVGGTMGSQMADALLCRHPEIDGVVIGECEETLADAVACVKARLPITGVLGFRVRGAEFKARPLIANLDDLGAMARDGLDERFQRSPPEERVAYLLAGRGCYANCSFCSVPSFFRQASSGKRWRGRGIGLIVDEMESFAKDFDVHRFVFQDENFFGPGQAGQARARELAAEIIRRKLQVQYFVTCRINDVDAATLRLMKASGLTRLGIGVESLSQRSLSLFSKGYHADAIYPALEIINDIGIACEVNLIFFEPMMDLADVRRNLDFIAYIEKHDRFTYSDAFPFKTLLIAPWSPIATTLAEQGALDSDGTTCRYFDRRVAALADFANRLHARLPVIFKQRILIASKDGLRAADDATDAQRELTDCTARLREWLGLTVVPRYMRAACDLVEKSSDDFTNGLAELERSFDDKMAGLRRLARRLENIVAERTGALG